MNLIDFLSQPGHWSISGLSIVAVMLVLLFFGGKFGVSSNLRTMCAIGGAGRHSSFFEFDWKSQIWNLVFIGGAVIGGYIGSTVLANPEPVQISTATQEYLQTIGIQTPQRIEDGSGYVPRELFASENLGSVKNLLLLIVGGFLVGFGTRYGGGCTSGHAISGLSNLQVPSLIAVIGFFIGGLFMAWVVLPNLLML